MRSSSVRASIPSTETDRDLANRFPSARPSTPGIASNPRQSGPTRQLSLLRCVRAQCCGFDCPPSPRKNHQRVPLLPPITFCSAVFHGRQHYRPKQRIAPIEMVSSAQSWFCFRWSSHQSTNNSGKCYLASRHWRAICSSLSKPLRTR